MANCSHFRNSIAMSSSKHIRSVHPGTNVQRICATDICNGYMQRIYATDMCNGYMQRIYACVVLYCVEI